LSHRHRQINSRAFTLIELIVVIVIMAILSGLSAIAYQQITADLRMSAAQNTVTAALDNARAMAIKKNRYVMTVFRPRLEDGGNSQVIDIVVAGWDGDSSNADRGDGNIETYDRFVPIQGIEVRTISSGMNVSGPGYAVDLDNLSLVSSYLPGLSQNEPLGSLIGILYSPEGRVVVRNAKSASYRIWVDFNQDGKQQISDTQTIDWPWPDSLEGTYWGFDLESPQGEPFVSITHILSVFNEEEFRNLIGVGQSTQFQDVTSGWPTTPYYCDGLNPWECTPLYDPCCPDGRIDKYDRNWLYSIYIHVNAERIQFNKYSGVPLK